MNARYSAIDFATGLIPIDRGIPLPSEPPKNARKYPFRDLELGDSFFAPCKTREQLKSLISRSSCSCRRFVTRSVVEDGVKGLRVWRVL